MMNKTEALIKAACKAQLNAYTPYSSHPVGAALCTADGAIYAGCNVENAAYPLGMCAEAAAISAMVAGGGRTVEHIIIVGPGSHTCTPCGGCRQKIREFTSTKGTTITVCDSKGEVLMSTTLDTLLPYSFGPENLSESSDG
nr:cytidine deaminase [Kordiimonas pumila]